MLTVTSVILMSLSVGVAGFFAGWMANIPKTKEAPTQGLKIRIISKGVPKNERPLAAVCGNCESCLDADRKDLVEVSAAGRMFYTGDCPVCSELVVFL